MNGLLVFNIHFVMVIVGFEIIHGQDIPAGNTTIKNCPELCYCAQERVYCDQLLLTDIPAKYPEQTEYLTLKNNKIDKISRRVFRNLVKVQYMLLSDNNITKIYPGAFRDTRNLLTLSLMSNNIKKLSPRSFRGLDNLQVLTLRHNKLVNIHRFLQPLSRIKLINVANNRIKKIKKRTFRHNIHLQFIDLRNNSIFYIEKKSFYGLFRLKAVVLRHNLLTQVHLLFHPGKYLDYLDFAHCKLTHVPTGLPFRIGNLRLGYNNISNITADSFNCTRHMNLLDLNHNQILEVGDRSFTRLYSLHDLHMKSNHLTKIPKVPNTIDGIFMNTNNIKSISENDLNGLNNLAYLVLKNNEIKEIPPKTLQELKKLKGLYLSNNQILKISPMAFYNLNELEALDLSNNPVHVLAPFSFYGLDNVRILRMASVGPKFADTRVFSDFKQLVFLDFSKSPDLVSHFAKKPNSLEYFKSVEDLNFMEDKLETLPSNFPEHFPMLRIVKLSGNPWHCDMSLLWLANWIRRSRVQFLYRDHVICASPPELKGVRLSDLYARNIPTTTANPNININITFNKTKNIDLNITKGKFHIENITSEEKFPKEKQKNRIEFVTFPNLNIEQNNTDVSNKINNFSSKVNVQNINVTLWSSKKLRHKNNKWRKFGQRRRKGFKIVKRGKGPTRYKNKKFVRKKKRERNRGTRKSNRVLGVAQNNVYSSDMDINSGEDSLLPLQGGLL